jgi:hypothetical protein
MSSYQDPSFYRLVIDIEAVSNTVVNAIGMVCANWEGKIVFEKSYYIKVLDSEIDPLCKERFWDKQPGLLEKFQNLGRSESEVIKEFVNDFDTLHSKLGVSEHQIKLYSDNPEYDFGRLTPYIKRHCDRGPLRYCLDGSYRSITDLGPYLSCNGFSQIVKNSVNKLVIHNHEPQNDAKNILYRFLIAESIQAHLPKDIFNEQVTHISEHTIDKILKLQ